MKKFKFLFTAASLKSRILALIAVVLGVASILVVTSAVSATVNGPLVEIPAIEMLSEAIDFDTEEISDTIDEMFDEIEREPEAVEEIEDMLGMDFDDLRDEMDIESVSLSSLDAFFQSIFESDLMAEIGDEVTVETVVGRVEKGTLIDDAPYYDHDYGHFVPELIEVDRRRLTFSVLVYDEVEKIAEGTHERFVIDNEKFLKKAGAKGAAQG